MTIGLLAAALATASGAVVGLTLGLIGGGGSILAVPLLVYLVGVPSPHIAIGTASIAVALNAAFGLIAHARLGRVKWPCAIVFATAGMLGALVGSALGKALDGTKLLALFGLVMIAIGIAMLRPPGQGALKDVRLTAKTAPQMLPRLLGTGGGVGLLSGFFGIGGGFLIVPGLVLATGMALQSAIASSLFAVTAFGLTTAGSYAYSGLVDWRLAALVIAGGIAGSLVGTRANARLQGHRRVLAGIFAAVVISVGIYIIAQGLPALLGHA
jgi:uncharacterized membrane protein YfcA